MQSSAKTSLYLPPDIPKYSVAVLASGGIESAILVSRLLDHFETVYPIYVRFGLSWEGIEEQCLRRFLAAIRGPRLGRLKTIDLPAQDIYGDHWSISGEAVPQAGTPDSAVYLPGRNLLLVSKAAIWCAINGIHTIAIGHLQTNPFSDSTSEFFRTVENVLHMALQEKINIIRPFVRMKKQDVVALGRDLPLEFSFSCISPVEVNDSLPMHCGVCNKCAERQEGFQQAGISDRTRYATRERQLVTG